MTECYSNNSAFKRITKNDFEFWWPTELSMYPPLDTMSAELRDEIKNFAWKIYLKGSQETMRSVEQQYPDWDKEKDDL
jgi:hypothetical protein